MKKLNKNEISEINAILLELNLSDVMRCCRTKEQIAEKIFRIKSNGDNFTSDNYGSEAADNGEYEIYYSEYSAENTMKNFVKWLFDNNA